MARLSQKRIIKALYDADGIIAVAAKNLGCARGTIYNRAANDEKIAAAMRDARECTKDFVESKLISNCKKGLQSAIAYYLNNQARDRGYGKPLLIAPTDPTGTKEYGSDVRNFIYGKLLPDLTSPGEEGEA